MRAVFHHPGRNTAARGARDAGANRRDATVIDDKANRRKLRQFTDQAYEEGRVEHWRRLRRPSIGGSSARLAVSTSPA
jgi:hypothetical protein